MLQVGLVLLVLGSSSSPLSAQETREATSLLGRPLSRPVLEAQVAAGHEGRLAAARAAFEAAPGDADAAIWLGRRTAYLGRYREAIEIFSQGSAQHPADARFLRHRGHRYLTVRELDRAIADLERATELIAGQPDAVEPDGLPNAQGIPLSSLHSNIRYHLGLAWYLKGDFARAAAQFERDVALAANDDTRVAASYWLYLSLRRQGKAAEAAKVLAPLRPDLELIENHGYLRLLMLFKGELSAEQARADGGSGLDAGVLDATQGYGIAIWHLLEGRGAEARKILERILEMPRWDAFGYLAAEAELARGLG
jgi:tetratricopeptide (TPR) repeat protein